MDDQNNHNQKRKTERDFLCQRVTLKKRFSNQEVFLYDHFYERTKVYPKNLIVIQNFVFFFIDSENYFEAKYFLPLLQRMMANKNLLIIREEEMLIKLLYNLFPDSYVHNITFQMNEKFVVTIHFLRPLQINDSIRYWNQYFKVLNKLFEDFVEFEATPGVSIVINYKLVDL